MCARPAASTCAAPTTRPTTPCRPGERYGFVYEINYLRCIHCDLCVEACPTEAITESKLFEFSFTNRQDAIYTKAELVVDDDGLPQQLPWEDWRDLDAVAAQSSAWVRATAPSGDADYVGKVAWSGELGFGVKPPEQGQSAPSPSRRARRARRRRPRRAPLMELFVFLVAGGACIAGALGVVLNSNPVHAALSLVGTLFGIAVLFVAQEANFLAAVQVIVYAGAIVVLFLFVLMLLGVDRAEDLSIEPLGGGQRIAAVIIGLAVLALPLFAFWSTDGDATGARPQPGDANLIDPAVPDINQLGESLFTTYLFAFEATQRAPRDRGGRRRRAGPQGEARRAHRRPARRRPRGRADAADAEATEERRAEPNEPEPSHVEGAEASMLAVAEVTPAWYLVLGSILFSIGAVGLLVRRNPLVMFMCVELMLNAVTLTFVTFSRMLDDVDGQTVVVFVLVVAAAEVVVGLGIIVALLRKQPTATADDINVLKG